MLKYYGLEKQYETIKEWYDGYRFGNSDVYCPWDVVNGSFVTKKITEELTYRELYDSIDHLWSVLFATGYLTKRKKTAPGTYELVIPNQEIRVIFTEQILSWFQEEARKDTPSPDAFCEAFSAGDPSTIEHLFTVYLKKTISICSLVYSWGFV